MPLDTTPTSVTIELPGYLSDHLKMWKDSGVPAPLNELQSIAAWLRTTGEVKDMKELQNRMRQRMLLLMKAANGVYEAGPYAEECAGIYENRPEQKPNPDQRNAEEI